MKVMRETVVRCMPVVPVPGVLDTWVHEMLGDGCGEALSGGLRALRDSWYEAPPRRTGTGSTRDVVLRGLPELEALEHVARTLRDMGPADATESEVRAARTVLARLARIRDRGPAAWSVAWTRTVRMTRDDERTGHGRA